MPKTRTMRARFAAQSVIEQLLLEQSILSPRSSIARMIGRSPLGADSVVWYQGARGEIAVGALLATLPPPWTVFHALPVGTVTSDIDHLVIGPGGVFTITSKPHRGKKIWVSHRIMMVGGERLPYIRNAEFEAERVTRLLRERMALRGAVRPVVAVVDPKRIVIQERPAQVKVIASAELVRWLVSLPVVLSSAECADLAGIVDNPDTWNASEIEEPADVLERFRSLDAEVRVARTRRLLWSTIGTAVGVGVGAWAGSAIVSALLAFLDYAGS